MKKLFLLSSLLFSLLVFEKAQALPPLADNTHSQSEWIENLSLYGGIGMNSLVHVHEHKKDYLGIGLNLNASLVYKVSELWSVDLGSMVRFNDTTSNILWDTILTLGVRRDLPQFSGPSLGTPYLHFFIGQGPSSLYVDAPIPELSTKTLHPSSLESNSLRTKSLEDDSEMDKYIAYSNFIGLGLGFSYKEPSGNTWYSEFAFIYQAIYDIEIVRMNKEVPEVIGKETKGIGGSAYSMSWSIGYRFF